MIETEQQHQQHQQRGLRVDSGGVGGAILGLADVNESEREIASERREGVRRRRRRRRAILLDS